MSKAQYLPSGLDEKVANGVTVHSVWILWANDCPRISLLPLLSEEVSLQGPRALTLLLRGQALTAVYSRRLFQNTLGNSSASTD